MLPKAAIKFDFDLAERNMDLYYPTLTFTGSRAQGTNNMIVSFGGSNTTVFPSLFASGQRGPVGLLLKPSLLPLVQLKSGGSPHLPLLGPPPVTRYGDYFGAAIDPTNSSISWMAGEYMQAPTIPPAVPFPLWSTVLSAVTSTPGNGTFSAGVKNITSPAGNIGGLPPPVPTNVTQSPGANNLTGQVCPDGNLPDVTTGLCADGSQPQAFNATASPTTSPNLPESQLVCSDGTAPDATTGLCADGSQPQPQSQSFNATAPGVTTPEKQLVCADGTAPDATTGLCADGSQPQAFNATASPTTSNLPESQLVCSDGTAPDATTGLCADGSQPQPQPQPQSQSFNATAPGVTTPEQQLVCADGTVT